MYRQKRKRNKGCLTPLSILSLNWTFFPFTNIVARPIGLAVIIVIMTVSQFSKLQLFNIYRGGCNQSTPQKKSIDLRKLVTNFYHIKKKTDFKMLMFCLDMMKCIK